MTSSLFPDDDQDEDDSLDKDAKFLALDQFEFGAILNAPIVRIDNLSRKRAGKELFSKDQLQTVASNLLNNTTTVSLTLAFCELDSEAIESIGKAISTNKTLKTLNLWGNKLKGMPGSETMAVVLGTGISRNSNLTELSLRGNHVGPEGTVGLAKGVMNHPRIRTLNLRYCEIADYGAKALAMVLLNNPAISNMDLSRNKITFDGAELLMKSLWLNTSLVELNLQMNPIKDKGGVSVGMALRYNTTLTSLNIHGCMVGDIGGEGIFDALRHDEAPDGEDRSHRRKAKRLFNDSLRSLRIGDNGLGDAACRSAGAALATNRALDTLDLSANRIGPQGAAALGAALRSNATLLDLSLSGNPLGDEGARLLGDGVRGNATLRALALLGVGVTFRADVDGFVSNQTVRLANDFNLSRVQADVAGRGAVRGFRVDVSRARLPGPAAPDQLHDLFRHTSRRLISLHCDGNDLGGEAPARLQASLGEFLAAAPALLDLSLAGCGLRCEHVRGLCFTSLTQAPGRARQAAGSGADPESFRTRGREVGRRSSLGSRHCRRSFRVGHSARTRELEAGRRFPDPVAPFDARAASATRDPQSGVRGAGAGTEPRPRRRAFSSTCPATCSPTPARSTS